MPAIVDVNNAKTQLEKLVDRAHLGEEFILAKAGKPYAVLGPLPPSATGRPSLTGRRPGRLKGQYVGPEILASLPSSELEAWGGHVRAIVVG